MADTYTVRVTLDFEPRFPHPSGDLPGITQRLKGMRPDQVEQLMRQIGELSLIFNIT
jgi:hypothetical protein